MSKRITSNEIKRQAIRLEFLPVKIKNWIAEPNVRLKSGALIPKPDYLAEIEWGKIAFNFVVEISTTGTPKKTFEAVYRLKQYISAIDESEKYYPLLIAPYFSEETLEYLSSEQVSGLDLSGNGVINVPDKIFVYRTGAKNKFPSSAPIKNIFRGVSSLVGRVFLVKPDYKAVGDVLKEIRMRSGSTTFATISKVLKVLEEELIISRSNDIRLVDGQRLLKNLGDSYQRPNITKTVKGKSKNLGVALTEISKNANQADILCAIDDPQEYAVVPMSSEVKKIYTEGIDRVLRGVEFTKDERFSNIELIETQEPTVYFDRRYNSDMRCYFTSPVQIYLELSKGGKREKDAAEQIAKNILRF